jgi:phenylalanyl-tRNA synthetase beta chain
MHTDASHRFERCVDPAHQARAVERATALLLDIVGGDPGPTVVTEARDEIPVWEPVVLRADRLEHLLGVRIDDAEVTAILERLDMTVDKLEGGWKVTPPSARSDIAIEPDLVEEVGRIYGYNRIPSKSLSGSVPMPPLSDGVVNLETIRRGLADRGYQEAVTYSFVSTDALEATGAAEGAIPLANPLSSDVSVMRTSLLPGLLQALVYNRNRQRATVRLFEIGKVFWQKKGRVHEEMRIAGVAIGRALPEQWGVPERDVDFFDIKGDVGALCELTGQAEGFGFAAGGPDVLHPGQAAKLLSNGDPVGWLGRLHPAVAQKLDLPGDAFVFELGLESLSRRRVPDYKEMSRFPSIRRDIAMIFEENVTSGEIVETVRGEVPAEMENEVILFDVFRGKNIGNARKSLTLGLILRAASRTLTDEEVDSLVAQVVAKLQQKFKATLRE